MASLGTLPSHSQESEDQTIIDTASHGCEFTAKTFCVLSLLHKRSIPQIATILKQALSRIFSAMRLLISLFFAIAAGCSFFPCSAAAQSAAQDNWTYRGTKFSSPTNNPLASIAIGTGGVYVGEYNTSTYYTTGVLQFTEAGAFVRRFSTAFTYVLGLACDSAGNVYVFDRGDSKVKVFDQNGTLLRQWGSAGTANGQFSVAAQTGPTMIAVDRNSQVYVCDPGNTRVQVFDTNGNFLRQWGQLGSLPGQFAANTPNSIAVSPDGRVYVGAKVFDSNGNYITTFLSYSGSPGGYAVGATSSDGLALVNGGYGDVVYTPDGSAAQSVQRSGASYVGSLDAAFSKRGDLFCNEGTIVYDYRREYASSLNFLSPPALPQPVVLTAGQRTGTSLFDLDYQVTDADSSTVTTGLLAFTQPSAGSNGTTLADAVVMTTFVDGTATNVGANQPTGTQLHVTWNMAADWAVNYANVQIEALAKDSRNLLGIHWITIPAVSPDPAVQVSSQSVDDYQLQDMWFWFLATHNGVTLTKGTNANNYATATITGSSGIYTGQVLATYAANVGYAVMPAGRAYAYEKMGVREIYGNEITRAKAGKYGFASVDSHSIVKQSGAITSYLEAWGSNGSGQANWLEFPSAGPVKVATSGSHTLYITSDGNLWSVGSNDSGQLGDGTTTTRNSPVLVTSSVAQIATGDSHSLFVKTDGTLWAMGANYYGQLGDGTTTTRMTPVQIASGVAQVSAGSQFSLFVKNDGTLWGMGYNGQGQLGNGTSNTATPNATPMQIASGVAQTSAGTNHTLFVKTNGSLWGCGYDYYGQLGDGMTGGQQNTPFQIVASGVASAAGGSIHSLFLKTNGSLWAMGYNGLGELGDGTTTQHTTPEQVVTGVSLIAAGGYHSLFVKTDATLWTMGSDDSGQLGDGGTTNRSTPAQVATNVTAIAAGGSTSLAIVPATP